MKAIDDALPIHSDRLMSIPGVVGLYQGLDANEWICPKVMVGERTAELGKRSPRLIEGYPVIIEEMGELRPMR
jgi:hypothetical protein